MEGEMKRKKKTLQVLNKLGLLVHNDQTPPPKIPGNWKDSKKKKNS